MRRITISGNYTRLSDSSLLPPRIPFLGGGQHLTALTSVAVHCRYRTPYGTNPFGFAPSAILLSSGCPPAVCGSLPVPKFPLIGELPRDSGSSFLGNVIVGVGPLPPKKLTNREARSASQQRPEHYLFRHPFSSSTLCSELSCDDSLSESPISCSSREHNYHMMIPYRNPPWVVYTPFERSGLVWGGMPPNLLGSQLEHN